MIKKIFILFSLVVVSFVALHSQDLRSRASKMRGLSYEQEIALTLAQNKAFNNTLSLWFIDAVTGKPIENASIEITSLGKFVTDEDGLIYFDIPDDDVYRFSFSKDGYVSFKDKFEIKISTLIFNKYSVPPKLDMKNVRFVLDWGEKPLDLDLHLVKEGDNGYHISYRNTKRLDDGTVWLDRDDMNSYGPETITVTENDNSASYKIFIHNYSDRNNVASTSLSKANAVVRIYNNNNLLATIQSKSSTSSGLYWHVADIDRGKIIKINEYFESFDAN